jgi:hypothetical protein
LLYSEIKEFAKIANNPIKIYCSILKYFAISIVFVNLETLISKLQEAGRIKPSRLANIKMSARHYAQALGCRSLKECSAEVFVTDKVTRNQKIEEHLKEEVSSHMLRNTKNDINFLLRNAEELNLIQPIPQNSPVIEEKKFGRRKITPNLPRIIAHEDTNFKREPYSLQLERWSEKLRRQYDEWLGWVTTEQGKIRGIDSYNRPATIETKTKKMEAFFGFLYNIRGISELDFEMLIDVAAKGAGDVENIDFIRFRQHRFVGLLEEFIQWHKIRYDDKFSSQARAVISVSISIAGRFYLLKAIKTKQYDLISKYESITSQIETLRDSLNARNGAAKASLSKYARAVSANELRRAAEQEFPHSQVLTNQQAGTVKATNAGRALAIMLMLELPIRNKNLREMQLQRNLVRNSIGKWVLTFRENEWISGSYYKRRRNNFEFHLREISPETAEYLDKYLETWHPILQLQIDKQIEEINSSDSDAAPGIQKLKEHKKYLFLTSRGKPFARQTFSKWIERGVFRWLGVRINPELIRQIASNKNQKS